VDIFAGEGVYCYAIEGGTVERFENEDAGPFGLRIHGEHGVWLYSHMADAFPEHGAEVDGGERIGRVGREGNAAGKCPHLHFGWRPPRARLRDPTALLNELFDGGDGSVTLGSRVNGNGDHLREAISTAELVLLGVAEQWDAGDEEARLFAAQLRSVVDTSRTYWREAPERVYEMLRDTERKVVRLRTEHPEWFEDDSVVDDVREAVAEVRRALQAAGEAGSGLAMAFGTGGIVFVLLLLFVLGGADGIL
jgi:murein DD-endopeptidase MepM/ murein hydrolase activator NlpD